MRPCFTFKAQAADKPAVLAIDDEIGFRSTQAKDFRSALESVASDNLEVEINSPGGDVFAGLGMYNMLRSFATNGKTVTTRVTGVAASIASIVMLAGDKREMPKNSFAMIHGPSTFAFGTADELRDAADVTDKIGASLRKVYVDRMGVSDDEATSMMAKDTWLTADECLSNGFATNLIENVSATAKFNMDRADLPEHVKAVFQAKATETKDDAPAKETTVEGAAPAAPADPEPAAVPANPVVEQIVARAKAAGLEAHSAVFALACSTVAEADVRIAAAREIVALCTIAKRPDDAAKHVKANTSIADVRAALIQAQAEADVHTDTTKPTESAATTASSGVDPKAIWNSHLNQQPKKGR